jgi:hypothetical protein
MTKKRNKANNELEKLGEIISGEMFLRKREEEITRVKRKAVENQKNLRRNKIVRERHGNRR